MTFKTTLIILSIVMVACGVIAVRRFAAPHRPLIPISPERIVTLRNALIVLLALGMGTCHGVCVNSNWPIHVEYVHGIDLPQSARDIEHENNALFGGCSVSMLEGAASTTFIMQRSELPAFLDQFQCVYERSERGHSQIRYLGEGGTGPWESTPSERSSTRVGVRIDNDVVPGNHYSVHLPCNVLILCDSLDDDEMSIELSISYD